MGERTSYAPGTFCWVELATTDAEAAKRFYQEIFGWEAEDVEAGQAGVYTMLRKDGKDVAGLYAMSDEQRAQGVPPHWLPYVSVEDVDVAAAQARDLGATLLAEPFEVGPAGRMAVLRDPAGAHVALWQPREHFGAALVNEPGAWCWNDHLSPDPETAARFYGGLFGWTFDPAAGDFPYRTIRNGETTNGGIMPMPPGQDGPPYWSTYFAVEDAGAALRAVEGAGGRTMMAPFDVPAGRFAVAQDPQGAAFALFQGRLDP